MAETAPLDELKAALKAATPGPWEVKVPDELSLAPPWVSATSKPVTDRAIVDAVNATEDDLALIVLLRNHAPALIEAHAERAQAFDIMRENGLEHWNQDLPFAVQATIRMGELVVEAAKRDIETREAELVELRAEVERLRRRVQHMKAWKDSRTLKRLRGQPGEGE